MLLYLFKVADVLSVFIKMMTTTIATTLTEMHKTMDTIYIMVDVDKQWKIKQKQQKKNN